MSDDKAVEADRTRKLSPSQMHFAMLVGEGKSQREAALTAFPSWRDWQIESVDSAASRLAKRSKVQEVIELHQVGAHNIGRSHLPAAITTQTDIMTDPDVKPADRLKAADSIADRFGAPRNAQIALNAQTLSLNLLADIETPELPDPTQLLPDLPEPIEQTLTPEPPRDLPHTHSPPQKTPGEDLEASRAQWAQIGAGGPPEDP